MLISYQQNVDKYFIIKIHIKCWNFKVRQNYTKKDKKYKKYKKLVDFNLSTKNNANIVKTVDKAIIIVDNLKYI